MGIFTVELVAVIGLTIILNVLIARGKSRQTDFDAISEEERLANQARRREIGPEVFVKPELDKLPFDIQCWNAVVAEAAGAVKQTAVLPMLRFDNDVSNNDLKYMYGVSNLDYITGMEENYRAFIAAMLGWAESLINAGEDSGAESVLNETLRLKSDFSGCYTLLAGIYGRRGDIPALGALRAYVNEADWLSLPGMRQKITAHIEKYLVNH